MKPPGRGKAGLPRPLESEVQRTGIAALKAAGFQVFRRNVMAMKVRKRLVRGAEPGQSDTYGKTPAGYHFELEWKRPGESPTQKQFEWLLLMNGDFKDRSVAFWADNVTQALRVLHHTGRGARVVYERRADGSYTKDYDLEYPAPE